MLRRKDIKFIIKMVTLIVIAISYMVVMQPEKPISHSDALCKEYGFEGVLSTAPFPKTKKIYLECK
jgi:hypothetical protein